MSLWRTARAILIGVKVIRVTVPHGVRLVRAANHYRHEPTRDTRTALVHEGAHLVHAAVQAARHMKPGKAK